MTERFDKFMKWTLLEKDGHRRLREDTPQKIRDEAIKVNNEYYKMTGRYMLRIDH